MKNINVQKAAKELQQNYRNKLDKSFKQVLKQLEASHSNRYRKNKTARLSLLSELEKCLSVGNKDPYIDREDFLNIVGPFCFEGWLEDWLLKLTRCRVPTLDYISKDLAFLKKEFAGVKFGDSELRVETYNINLKDIDFGPFEMVFSLNDDIPLTHNDVCVITEALEPNYPPGDDSFPHPHVDCNCLCMGEGRRAAASAVKDLRLLDYFQIVNVVLNTYGDGPHLGIEAWQQEPCNDCGDRRCEDDMCCCNACGEVYCYDCIYDCIGCYENYCAFCAKSCCTQCGCRLCDECGTSCVVCDEICCRECADYSCCGRACVDNCCENCDCCSELICNSCIETCSDCGRTVCKKCIEECGSCSEKICRSCLTECDECDSNYHEKCEYECCE
ncbi:MAG: hypothetical protein ACXAC5_04430 [Promethearchaeota archaeon]